VVWAEKATDLFRSIKYSKGEIAALETVVQANLASGDSLAAREEAQAALKRSRRLADTNGEAAALEMVVLSSVARKDFSEALSAAEKALATIREMGDRSWELRLLRTVARLQAKLKNPSKAVRIAEEADKLVDESMGGDEIAKASTLHTLADVLFEKGDYDKSLSVALQEKEIHTKRGDTTKEAQAGFNCARAYYMKGSYPKCLEAANNAQEALREAGDRWGQAQSMHMAAQVHAARKEHDLSLRVAERAARLFKETGDQTSEARALLTACTEAVMLCANGGRGPIASKNFNDQMAKALRQSDQARDAALKVGEERLYASALRINAQVTMYNGKAMEASGIAQEAATVSKSMSDSKNEGTAKVIQCEALIATRKYPKATEAAEDALELFRKIGDASGEATAIWLLARIESETSEFEMVKRGAGESGPMAEDSGQAAPAEAAGGAVGIPDKEKFLATLPINERIGFQIKDLIVGITGREQEIANDQTVMETGLTSISAIMLRDQISDAFPDVEDMEMTFAFEYPTVSSMTDFIMEAIGDA
jgi:tetratricopeptide (TPR) repeat protein